MTLLKSVFSSLVLSVSPLLARYVFLFLAGIVPTPTPARSVCPFTTSDVFFFWRCYHNWLEVCFHHDTLCVCERLCVCLWQTVAIGVTLFSWIVIFDCKFGQTLGRFCGVLVFRRLILHNSVGVFSILSFRHRAATGWRAERKLL